MAPKKSGLGIRRWMMLGAAMLSITLWILLIAGWARSKFRLDDLTRHYRLKSNEDPGMVRLIWIRSATLFSSDSSLALVIHSRRELDEFPLGTYWQVYPQPRPLEPRVMATPQVVARGPAWGPIPASPDPRSISNTRGANDRTGELNSPPDVPAFHPPSLTLAPPSPKKNNADDLAMDQLLTLKPALPGDQVSLTPADRVSGVGPTPPTARTGSLGYFVTVTPTRFVTGGSLPVRYDEPGRVSKLLGIHAYASSTPFDIPGEISYALILPYWAVTLPATLMMVATVLLTRRSIRRHRRLQSRLCLRCGYDLRASRDRCPECGTEREHEAEVAEKLTVTP